MSGHGERTHGSADYLPIQKSSYECSHQINLTAEVEKEVEAEVGVDWGWLHDSCAIKNSSLITLYHSQSLRKQNAIQTKLTHAASSAFTCRQKHVSFQHVLQNYLQNIRTSSGQHRRLSAAGNALGRFKQQRALIQVTADKNTTKILCFPSIVHHKGVETKPLYDRRHWVETKEACQ